MQKSYIKTSTFSLVMVLSVLSVWPRLGFADPLVVENEVEIIGVPIEPINGPGSGTTQQLSSFGFALEQDLLTIPFNQNEDRNYTMGIALNFGHPDLSKHVIFEPLAILSDEIEERDSSIDMASTTSLSIGVTAFTPDCLPVREVIEFDRPYASIIYATLQQITALNNPNVNSMPITLRQELTVGVLGLGVARIGQTLIHNAARTEWEQTERLPLDEAQECQLPQTPQTPYGWSNQISHGGEPTMRYMFGVDMKVLAFKHLEGFADIQAEVGYYTSLSGGKKLRVGIFKYPYWWRSDPFSSVNRVDERRDELYVFGEYYFRYYAYNVFLQGQFRQSNHRLRGHEINRKVHNGRFGLAATVQKFDLEVWYALRSSEINVGERRWHHWGGLSLSWNSE